jgi:hypothetical protein
MYGQFYRHPHGDRGCYLEGCRCDKCRAANTAHELKRRRDHAVEDALRALARNQHRFTDEHRAILRELADAGLPRE